MSEEIYGFINNMSSPRTLYQLEKNMENNYFNVMHILSEEFVEWTVDKNAKPGQLCFWSFANSAITHILNIEKEIQKNQNHPRYNDIISYIELIKSFYEKYGGKIFAVGRVIGNPFFEQNETRDYIHWTSKCYAPIFTFYILNQPIHKNDFSFISLNSKGAITNLNKNNCEELLKLIKNKENVNIPLIDSEMLNHYFIDTSNF